ncbi:ATP synthase delta chain, chloroplastic-like [Typha latifolia]|uniref:ATP synthase delta chain, chloroplastic-like n=1 Tax=Typha latifolia TaxID=4733 RepID=UPI003C30C499
MNILNQSINPGAQPVFTSKDSGIQELRQKQLPTGAVRFDASLPLKASRTALTISTTESSGQQQTINSESKTAIQSVEFQPITLNFLNSILEKDKLNTINDGSSMSQLPTDHVLIVAVSSAVKLDAKQIDLITRKMQRLTGFRNLRLENVVDPSLIAGFVISYGTDESQIIDLSVKGQLAALAARVETFDRRTYNHV